MIRANPDPPYGTKYITTFVDTDLVAGVLTVTHNLGRAYVVPAVYDDNDVLVVPDDYTATDLDTLTVDLSSASPLPNTWTIAIVGVG